MLIGVDAYASTGGGLIVSLPEGARSLCFVVAFGHPLTPSCVMGTHVRTKETSAVGSDLDRRTYTVAEAAKVLGISRSTAYECVRSGEIQSLRFRSRIVIPAAALSELLAEGE